MKKQLFNRIALLIVFIFLLNMAAGAFYWYSLIWWFDMPMHFLGGLWLSLAGLWFYYFFLKPSPTRPLTVARVIAVGILSGIVLGIGWEFLEYAIQAAVPGAAIASPLDSLSDLFFDTAGAVCGVIYMLRHSYPGENNEHAVY